MIDRIDSFIAYFETVRRRTLHYCRAVPSEQIDWAPRPGELSFGDLVRHIAAAEQMFVGVAAAGRWAYPGHERERGATHAEAMAHLAAVHADAVAALGALDDEALRDERPALDGRPVAVWRVLMLMVEHEVHHRSQIASHLAELGVAPPQIYGLSLEELMVRSGGL
ncbi:MAG TPA: DinB family protein [Chloroflexaceae bacterium]|nr:DinB family protein [Chloroflexaceae bacterium]